MNVPRPINNPIVSKEDQFKIGSSRFSALNKIKNIHNYIFLHIPLEFSNISNHIKQEPYTNMYIYCHLWII